jgi:hypothetical protein
MPRSGRVDLDSLRQDSRARCLPRGDSYVDLLLWPRICPGVPRERGSSPSHVWAHPWSSLTLLLKGSCRTLVEGQLSIPQGLGFCGRAPEPHACEVDQSPDHLLLFIPHAPFPKKGGGVEIVVLPSFGRVPTASGELLTGEFE